MGGQTRYKMMSEGHAAKTNHRVKYCTTLEIKIRYGIMDIHKAAKYFGKSSMWGYRRHKKYVQVDSSDGKMHPSKLLSKVKNHALSLLNPSQIYLVLSIQNTDISR